MNQVWGCPKSVRMNGQDINSKRKDLKSHYKVGMRSFFISKIQL
jgi:hypothetical protein